MSRTRFWLRGTFLPKRGKIGTFLQCHSTHSVWPVTPLKLQPTKVYNIAQKLTRSEYVDKSWLTVKTKIRSKVDLTVASECFRRCYILRAVERRELRVGEMGGNNPLSSHWSQPGGEPWSARYCILHPIHPGEQDTPCWSVRYTQYLVSGLASPPVSTLAHTPCRAHPFSLIQKIYRNLKEIYRNL